MVWELFKGNQLLDTIDDNYVTDHPGTQKMMASATFDDPDAVTPGLRDPGYVQFKTDIRLWPVEEYVLKHSSETTLTIVPESGIETGNITARALRRR